MALCEPKYAGAAFMIFNYFNNLRILQFLCISWKIKCFTRSVLLTKTTPILQLSYWFLIIILDSNAVCTVLIYTGLIFQTYAHSSVSLLVPVYVSDPPALYTIRTSTQLLFETHTLFNYPYWYQIPFQTHLLFAIPLLVHRYYLRPNRCQKCPYW